MRKLRVLALMDDVLVPPGDTTGHDVGTADWKTEFDVVSTLRESGHEVHSLGVRDDLGVIRNAIRELKPHIAFNLLEDFHDVPIFDQNLVSYLELLRVPYTGCNPRGLLLARDKALAKKLCVYHRVPVADFAVCRIGRKFRRPKGLRFPLIVKSLTKEASAGLSQASVVGDDAKLEERVRFMHTMIGTDALVEEYIDGREFYVGVLGNQRLELLPVWELVFKRLPDDARPIASNQVKWNAAYRKKWGIDTCLAKNLPDGMGDKIHHIARRVYRTLGLSGYARIDLRMDATGRCHVLEANPNPQLAYGEDFAESAEHAGIEYDGLLDRILRLGLRWRPDQLR